MQSARKLRPLWISAPLTLITFLIVSGGSKTFYHHSPLRLLSFTKNQVKVVVLGQIISPEHLQLTAILTPQPNFHLYGADLPRDGIQGIGRPTRFDLSTPLNEDVWLIPGIRIQPEGTTKYIQELHGPIAVFPAGPVSLSRVVRVNPDKLPGRLLVKFTYMSCHDTVGCTSPVRDYQQYITLNRKEFQ